MTSFLYTIKAGVVFIMNLSALIPQELHQKASTQIGKVRILI